MAVIPVVASDGNVPKLYANTFASRPAATAVPSGSWFYATDEDAIYRSDGAVWQGPVGGDLTVEDESATSYTIVSGDAGKLKRFTNASLVTVTLPDGLAIGTIVELLSWGAGGLAVQDNGTSIAQREGSVSQYDAVSCVVVAADTWSVVGPLA